MKIINVKDNEKILREYVILCSDEWGNKKRSNLEEYIVNKINRIKNTDNFISIIGLIDSNNLIGFISLFKNDGFESLDLTPWYATMYVKKEYRGKGYSKILNDAIINEARRLGYDRIYLKSDLIGYYENFGAIFMKKLDNGENLFYIDVNKN